MREVCGNCKHNKRAVDEYSQCEWWCCGNEESDKYCVPTFYDDTCEDWEKRDDQKRSNRNYQYSYGRS